MLGAVALTATACGSPTNDNSGSGGTGSSGKSVKACMVLDTGGVDDHSFNQSSWAGMQAAKKANSNIDISYVSSNSQNDYTPNLTAETNKGCDTVIAVGGLMSSAVEKIAKANPKQHYAEIDAPSSGDNVYGLQYNTAQGGFIGGYLAAGMTKTGKVGTFGGLNIPPVTIYMDGFWEGVQYYNKQNGTNVKVLGWDETKQKAGLFANSFTDQNKGKAVSQGLIQQGADIIFPVAGGTGLGAGAAAQASNGKVSVIWVDTDGCQSAAQYCKYFLSSVTKGLTTSVTRVRQQGRQRFLPLAAATSAPSTTGAPAWRRSTTSTPRCRTKLKSELDQVKSDIVSGKIKITSPSQPK